MIAPVPVHCFSITFGIKMIIQKMIIFIIFPYYHVTCVSIRSDSPMQSLLMSPSEFVQFISTEVRIL